MQSKDELTNSVFLGSCLHKCSRLGRAHLGLDRLGGLNPGSFEGGRYLRSKPPSGKPLRGKVVSFRLSGFAVYGPLFRELRGVLRISLRVFFWTTKPRQL